MGDRWHAALDMGGTKIAVGLVKNQRQVAEQERIPSRTPDPAAAVAQIGRILRRQCGRAGIELSQLSGAGIVCAGPVDTERGTIENPYTLPDWEHYPIAAALQRELSVPVKLENDANGALMGEIRLQGLSERRVMMITFGTGIGAAFWNGRELYRTGGRYHPELGHIIIGGERSGCYCGRDGCMESLLSGTALHRRAKQAGYQDFMEAVNGAEAGEPAAAGLLARVEKELCSALWNFGLLFQPDVYVFGGGMGEACFDLLSAMARRASMAEDFVRPFEILPGSRDVNPALVGGANL